MEFHGAPLGIHSNMGWILVPVVTAFALLASWWVAWNRQSGNAATAPPWTPTNRRLLLTCLALLPVRFGGCSIPGNRTV